ncbi:MAG: PolC-type DNA polymerase III [Erysipelotrichaceae bacterium]
MSLSLTNLIKKMKFEEKNAVYFNDGEFSMTPVYAKKSHSLELELLLSGVLPFQIWETFISRLTKMTRCHVELVVKCKEDKEDIFELRKYVAYYTSSHPQYTIFQDALPSIEKEYIIFRYASEEQKDKAIQCKHLLEAFLNNCGFKRSVIIDDLILDKAMETVDKPIENNSNEIKYEDKKYNFKPKTKKGLDQYTKLGIHEIKEEMQGINIKGKIFDKENRTLRTGKDIQTLWICDNEDAIVIKRFERGSTTKAVLDEIDIGDYVSVYGRVDYDAYSRELVMMPDVIQKIPEVKRVDEASEKRVELHVHTKTSEMDGVCNIEEFIEQANAWGHNAIAISDHVGVQSFPKAQHAVEAINKTRETPFKMIYGVEMNMVDPILHIVRNSDNRNLEDSTYCVFDLETTGLSSRYDHIIEFGGQIVKNRACVKKLQMFIKSPVPISAYTTQLTKITENDLVGAKSFEECIDEILDFIGDHILVAHNADFDVNFLNDSLIRINREPLKNPVIDTLDLSRSLQSERKSYKLGMIARSYGIRYDEEGAHRADYDAEILANVYMNMLNDLKHIHTLNDLQAMQDETCFRKVFKKHVTVLVKNAAGLKELFELITLSHCKYLAYSNKNASNIVAEPRILRDEISKRRIKGNLLIGTSCFNGEVFDIAQTRNQEQLKAALAFYDYVEIQPLENYRPLIDKGAICDEQRLKQILTDIIDTAQAMGKLVVASGDAHYVDPQQKLIRDIYISSQAIGGVHHPLYVYDSEQRLKIKNPDQHFLTTKEMLDAFAWLPEALAYEMVVTNTNKVAEQIEAVYPVKDRLYPPDIEGSDVLLEQICYERAHKIYGDVLPEIVDERLKRELKSIIGHGFYVVYYISHLLVKKSNDDGYLVGSRGSVGSSFVATMAGITEVNPLAPHYVCENCHYVEFFEDGSVASGFDLPDKQCPNCGKTIRGDGQDIPFETFLGFEGDKVPDIDLNFSSDYQPIAHAYTKEVFGDDHVFRAGTIGTVAEQTAYGYVKGYEEEMGLEGSLRRAQELRLAKGCEGVKRTTGQHPGGIIVIPLNLDVHDFTPVQYPANNPFSDWKTTHFDFHQIHDNVLKFDILGHVDPTAMKMLERISGIDVRKIPMNDPQTMSIFSGVEALHIDTAKSTEKTGAAGLPEFGTPFVRGILEMTKPTTFDELVRISGLSHGTDVWLNNARDLVDGGICTLKNVIGCRDDIMVYLLHKGLKPKTAFMIMESVRKGRGLKPEWINDMKEKGVENWYIESCLKIKYMFPKAHAVAYVMMAIRIAYFKVHYPQYYYCMFFSIRCDAYDIDAMIKGEQAIRSRMKDINERLNNNELKKDVTKKDKDIYVTLELALEMVLRGYRFGNIDLMKSEAKEFIVDPEDKNVIIPPFASIDGLGSNVADSVVEARSNGLFLSKQDLQDRTSLNGTSIKKLEALGVLSSLQEENQMSLFG